jgi:hypothetical protein
MKLTKLGAACCALISALVWTATPAFAGEPITFQGTVTLPNGQTTQGSVQVSASNPLPVTGGGGGGGATTIADGADTAEGTTTDSTWDGVSAATQIAIQKYIGTKSEATRAAIAAPQTSCGSFTCTAMVWRNPSTGALVDPDANTNTNVAAWGLASTTVLGKVGFDTSANTVKPGDGTNTITVKASATAPSTSDTAMVVVQSPNPSPVCTSSMAINQTGSTDLVTSTGKLYICSIMLVSATAQSVSIVEGTGTTCATGIAALIGGTTASMAVAANGGLVSTAYRSWIQTKTTADHLCLLQSGSGNISGVITYKDF